jgi:hypothetical protein
MSEQTDEAIVWKGRHLLIADRGGWEFAKRNIGKPAVGIVAITDDRKVVLVEQYRPPLNGNVIELPAGLSGDRFYPPPSANYWKKPATPPHTGQNCFAVILRLD